MARWVVGLACIVALGTATAAAQSPLDLGRGWRSLVARTPPANFSRPHPAVVRVIAPERNGASYGSGTLVDVQDRHGLVLTNWHVVCDAEGPVEVVFPNGFRSATKCVKLDRDWDLAALVCWRPDVTPVPVAARPPQAGEWLAIAGYGSGDYREASGRCTQFLAPGVNFPAEIVELSAAARQGDSGGPILNSRGELAGVLFGATWGTTSGSHAGRVRQFLADVLPRDGGPALDGALVASAGGREASGASALFEGASRGGAADNGGVTPLDELPVAGNVAANESEGSGSLVEQGAAEAETVTTSSVALVSRGSPAGNAGIAADASAEVEVAAPETPATGEGDYHGWQIMGAAVIVAILILRGARSLSDEPPG